jgi:uncharacterized protein (DUF362 family)
MEKFWKESLSRREFLKASGKITVGFTALSWISLPHYLFSEESEAETLVAVAKDRSINGIYPINSPFDPPEIYPEYPYEGNTSVNPENKVYALVRQALFLTNPVGFGTPSWNPLSQVIRPGCKKIVIKADLPNEQQYSSTLSTGWGATDWTHPSVLRAVIDYVVIAIKSAGITDAQIMVGDACFELDQSMDYMANKRNCFGRALWDTIQTLRQRSGLNIKFQNINVKPYHIVDLGEYSEHSQPDAQYGSIERQSLTRGSYPSPWTIYDADVIILVPTVQGRKYIGTSNCIKLWMGSQASDGPSKYPMCDHDDLPASLMDLNKIGFYYQKGEWRAEKRAHFIIVDGIVGGQGHAVPAGRESSIWKPANMILAGYNPVAVDTVLLRCMGWDYTTSELVQRTSNIARDKRPIGKSDPAITLVSLPEGESLTNWFSSDEAIFATGNTRASKLNNYTGPSVEITIVDTTVTARVTHSSPISRVDLWIVNSRGEYQFCKMTPTGNNRYTATLPPGAEKCWVRAQDDKFRDGISEIKAVGTAVRRKQMAELWVGQSYPTPITREAYIPYEVPRGVGAREVRIKIYNPLGQLIREANLGQQKAGKKGIFYWDGRDHTGGIVSSGVYIYRLSIGGREIVKNMVVIR